MKSKIKIMTIILLLTGFLVLPGVSKKTSAANFDDKSSLCAREADAVAIEAHGCCLQAGNGVEYCDFMAMQLWIDVYTSCSMQLPQN